MSCENKAEGTGSVRWTLNEATAVQILQHLRDCDSDYTPPLSSRVGLAEYANKISLLAVTYEAWIQDRLVGLVAVYFPENSQAPAFVSNVSVIGEFRQRCLGRKLLDQCIRDAHERGVHEIRLEVDPSNLAAGRLYQKFGFENAVTAAPGVLTLKLTPNQEMS